MADYLGVMGSLIPFERVTEHSVDYADPYTIQEARTKSWGFVNNPLPGKSPREWSLDIMAKNNDMGNLVSLYSGGFGWTTLNYIPESAQLTNSLTVSQSLLQGVANGSPMATPEGVSGNSIVGGATTVIASKFPVIPNKTFTASMWVLGTDIEIPSLDVLFYTSAGVGISTRKSSGAFSNTPQKVSYTGKTPATAGYALIRISGHVQATMPAFTYTDKPVPWDAGGSSTSVLMTKLSAKSQLLEANGCSGNLYRAASLKLKEM